MTFERRRSVSPQMKTDPLVRNKYRIAQQYLKNNPVDFSDHVQLRYIYIALVQSIAGAQELGVPHSKTTIERITEFLELAVDQIRYEIIFHSTNSQIIEDLWELIDNIISQSIDASEEIASVEALVSEPTESEFVSQWNRLLQLFGSDFREAVELNITTDKHQSWINYSEDIHNYLYNNHGNPVILFERLRDLFHVNGAFLEDLFDINGKEHGHPFWTDEEYEKVRTREWDEPYNTFMDMLSMDAFKFDLPYKFGFDGNKRRGSP
jgi:hypothetical protein